MNNLKVIAENYFKNFSNKDISALENMFTDDVELRDWVFNVRGIKNVIDVNIKIFLYSIVLKIFDEIGVSKYLSTIITGIYLIILFFFLIVNLGLSLMIVLDVVRIA